jgi:hypothetical protein
MTHHLKDAAAIIELWPSQVSMANDINAKPYQVRDWKRRGWIPAEYDLPIIAAARRRRLPVTLQVLAMSRAYRVRQNDSESAA